VKLKGTKKHLNTFKTKREKQILGTQMTFHNKTNQIKKLQREEQEELKEKTTRFCISVVQP